jgi:hypothetical protein
MSQEIAPLRDGSDDDNNNNSLEKPQETQLIDRLMDGDAW